MSLWLLFLSQWIAPNQIREFVFKSLKRFEDLSGTLLHFEPPSHALKPRRRLVYNRMLDLPEKRSKHRHNLEFGPNPVARPAVTGSTGLFSPRLSPSGRYLVALPVDCRKLLVYDFQKKEWKTLAEGNFTSPDWSPDENYVYAGGSDKGRPAVVRIRVADRTMEPVVYASGFPSTGSIGFWFGLGPGQSVIALHDTGIKDIYSLNWPRH